MEGQETTVRLWWQKRSTCSAGSLSLRCCSSSSSDGKSGMEDEIVPAKRSFTGDEAERIGKMLGINWDKFNVEQFRTGMDVELEHGLVDPHTNVTNDDTILTGKIALAHLNEFPDYYTRLERMEKDAHAYWHKAKK